MVVNLRVVVQVVLMTKHLSNNRLSSVIILLVRLGTRPHTQESYELEEGEYISGDERDQCEDERQQSAVSSQHQHGHKCDSASSSRAATGTLSVSCSDSLHAATGITLPDTTRRRTNSNETAEISSTDNVLSSMRGDRLSDSYVDSTSSHSHVSTHVSSTSTRTFLPSRLSGSVVDSSSAHTAWMTESIDMSISSSSSMLQPEPAIKKKVIHKFYYYYYWFIVR